MNLRFFGENHKNLLTFTIPTNPTNRFFLLFGRFLVQMPYHAGMNGI